MQVAGVCWLNEHALAVVSEQGPRSHVRLYDASGQLQIFSSSTTLCPSLPSLPVCSAFATSLLIFCCLPTPAAVILARLCGCAGVTLPQRAVWIANGLFGLPMDTLISES